MHGGMKVYRGAAAGARLYVEARPLAALMTTTSPREPGSRAGSPPLRMAA